VPLDNGLRKYLGGQHFDLTCKLEFDRSAGWDRSAVEQWIEQQFHLRDLGRTVWLDRQHRMVPPLADVVADLLGMDSRGNQAAGAVVAQPAVEFIAVLASAKAKPGAGRNGSRGPRNGEPPAANRLPAIGAGLEIDLAALRQGDRVPEELRALVPGRGFVNITEARAVVRKLEELFRQEKPASCAVIALYASQADLIRRLIHQSPSLAAHAVSIPVGPPAAFRCQEADVVLVSLTRSHSHRAVAYGECPAALELAMTRARRLLVLVGDPGNLARRSQWRGVLDHLDEQAGNREAWLFGQLLRYLQGRGNCQSAFRLSDSATT
jgi:AAA domain